MWKLNLSFLYEHFQYRKKSQTNINMSTGYKIVFSQMISKKQFCIKCVFVNNISI